MRNIIVIAGALLVSLGAQAQETPDLRERLAACAACHGERGEGAPGAEYYPPLAGKPAGYLFDQMQAFRDGRRHYPQMSWLLRYLGDAYLHEIAQWYAQQPSPPSANVASAGEPPARAMHLVQQGDDGLGVPACSACHGEHLQGLEPGVPALRGLPADYVVAQLGAWKVGTRHAREPDCMAGIARRLSADDIRAVATMLSRLPHGDARPAPAGAWRLPRACGDLPAEVGAQEPAR